MTSKRLLTQMEPQAFVAFLKQEGITRFCLIRDRKTGAVIPSHPALQPLADFVAHDKRDFMEHEGLFFQVTRALDTLQGAFIHRTNRGQAAGGVRYWRYDTVEAYLRDGLRLAKGMTRKNALAGLWWGGGKGVMAHNPEVDKENPVTRASIYREYGELMTSIRGCYVTAEDVGTRVEDMAKIFESTRFTTCIPESLGGSGNPSVPTARGVLAGMAAALDFLKMGTLEGRTVAIQGMGNVGGPLIGLLFESGVRKIKAHDIHPGRVDSVRRSWPNKDLEALAVEPGDDRLFEAECDILSPCATGAVLNAATIPRIRARIVCGAANNQLEDTDRDDKALFDRGVLYVPDFLTNRMGIVNCANEQSGYVDPDPLIERHLSKDWDHSIHRTALRVFEESRRTGDPPAKVALQAADALSLENHPLFGHRGVEIIASLGRSKWHESRK